MSDVPCNGCGKISSSGSVYCTSCGRRLDGVEEGVRCNGCGKISNEGNVYCTTCGRLMCCERSAREGHIYCTTCGRRTDGTQDGAPRSYVPEKKDLFSHSHPLIVFAGLALLLGCVPMLVFEMGAVFWAMPGVISGMEGWSLGIMFLLPTPVYLFYISGTVALFYYLFLVAAVVVSFMLLIYNSREGLADLFRKKTDKLNDMPLYSVVTLFAMYISISLILILLVNALGYEPATLDDPAEPWMLWYALLNASVWEEVICRVLMIGVPLMIAAVALKEKGAWKRLFGKGEMDRFAIVFILISSAVFAFGHLQGWDLFKLIPTFISGLALGYLFVKYGLYASIMMHFLIDYMSSVTWIFGSGAAETMLGLFILFVMIAGLPFILVYAKRGYEHFRKTLL